MEQGPQADKPLLTTKQQQFDEKISYTKALREVFWTAIVCFSGVFFYPTYTLVNAGALGH